MANTYKKKNFKPLPSEAKIVYQKRGGLNVKMAQWVDNRGRKQKAEVHKDGERIVVTSKVWYMQYRDESGIVRRESTKCTNREVAEKVLAERLDQVEKIRNRVVSPEVVKVTNHAQVPLSDHVDDYLEFLGNKTVKGRKVSQNHVDNVSRHLERIQSDCGFRWLVDINRDTFSRWMSQRLEAEEMSPRTVNTYRSAWMAFSSWCIKENRVLVNPLEGLPTAEDQESKPRRALTPEELKRLFYAARTRPLTEARIVRTGPRAGQPVAKVKRETEQRLIKVGVERELMYRTMAFTGLRKKEVASLTVKDLHLGHKHPYISLRPMHAKNVKPDEIPLKEDLAESLSQWVANKLPNTKVFNVPRGLIKIFDKDLAFAKIEKVEDGETACVHSLRHSFASMLAQAGVSPQMAMRLLRHSDINLTAKRYTHIELTDRAQAIAALPDVSPKKSESVQKTGTDGGDIEVSKKVPNSGAKQRINDKSWQDGESDEGSTKLIKPHFPAENEAQGIAGDRIRTDDVQLGKLAFYH